MTVCGGVAAGEEAGAGGGVWIKYSDTHVTREAEDEVSPGPGGRRGGRGTRHGEAQRPGRPAAEKRVADD